MIYPSTRPSIHLLIHPFMTYPFIQPFTLTLIYAPVYLFSHFMSVSQSWFVHIFKLFHNITKLYIYSVGEINTICWNIFPPKTFAYSLLYSLSFWRIARQMDSLILIPNFSTIQSQEILVSSKYRYFYYTYHKNFVLDTSNQNPVQALHM